MKFKCDAQINLINKRLAKQIWWQLD